MTAEQSVVWRKRRLEACGVGGWSRSVSGAWAAILSVGCAPIHPFANPLAQRRSERSRPLGRDASILMFDRLTAAAVSIKVTLGAPSQGPPQTGHAAVRVCSPLVSERPTQPTFPRDFLGDWFSFKRVLDRRSAKPLIGRPAAPTDRVRCASPCATESSPVAASPPRERSSILADA